MIYNIVSKTFFTINKQFVFDFILLYLTVNLDICLSLVSGVVRTVGLANIDFLYPKMSWNFTYLLLMSARWQVYGKIYWKF